MSNAYYQVGDVTTTSGLAALVVSHTTNTPIHYTLHASLTTYPWHVPPALSVEHYESEQVKRIHALGKPIRVFFSGGTDSYSIAHAFARNGIHVVYTLVEYGTIEQSVFDAPALTATKLLYLERLHEKFNLPKPEYEVISVDDAFLQRYFSTANPEKDAYYLTNRSFNANNIGRYLEWSTFNAQAYSNVFGVEKPRLYVDDKGVYWQVTDTMSMYGDHNDFDTIWFYLDHAMPELISAQCHSVLKIATAHATVTSKGLPLILNQLQTDANLYHQWCVALGRQTNIWISTMSKICKVSPGSIEPTDRDKRYIHYDHYRENNKGVWEAFKGFYDDVLDITDNTYLVSHPSERYYLKG